MQRRNYGALDQVIVGEQTPLARQSSSFPVVVTNLELRRIIRFLSLACLILTFACAATLWKLLYGSPSTTPLATRVSLVHRKDQLYSKVPSDDFGKFKEYSVVHTERSLNLMSKPFQKVMNDVNMLLKTTYNAKKAVIVPGSGTFGMESVARQFATGEHVLVLRNGYFSYRWSEIFEYGGIPKSHTVLVAQPVVDTKQYRPYPIGKALDRIRKEQPAVLFAPHVETSTGMILPDDYIRKLSDAIHEHDGLMVLDCIASGSIWVDMLDSGVDVLITAPQKGWTSQPCAALVQLSERAVRIMDQQPNKCETSFSMSLRRWSAVMDAYENGGFAYHTTPPTDSLRFLQQVSVEMLEFGLSRLQEAQIALGNISHQFLASKGLRSVAAPGYQAPSVLVYYSPGNVTNADMVKRFHEQGLQIATGVPWMIGEPPETKSFRIGLFGINKLANVHQTSKTLDRAVSRVLETIPGQLEKKKARNARGELLGI